MENFRPNPRHQRVRCHASVYSLTKMTRHTNLFKVLGISREADQSLLTGKIDRNRQLGLHSAVEWSPAFFFFALL